MIKPMSIKNILITEPENLLLRRWGMRLLANPDLRLICFNGEKRGNTERLMEMHFATDEGLVRFRDNEEVSVDEIWHTTNPTHSLQECRNKTERVLHLAVR